jgi:hypothetical protein
MKAKKTLRFLFWVAVIVATLLVSSHFDYEMIQEDIEAQEAIKEAEMERLFLEYHDINY